MGRNDTRAITPDAFSVSPDLIGIVLARPARRLVAIGIDGILIAILSAIGGSMLLAFGAAIILWRAAAPPPDTRASRSSVRTALRVASAVAVVVFVSMAYSWANDKLNPNDRAAATEAENERDEGDDSDDDRGDGGVAVQTNDVNVDASKLGLKGKDLRLLPVLMSIASADDSAEARPLADTLAKWIAARPDTAARRGAAVEALRMFAAVPGAAGVRAAMLPFAPEDSTVPQEALRAEIAALNATIGTLKREKAALKDRAEKAEEGFTMKRALSSMSDLLGFGLGWGAFYFTGMLLLMKGQTPGKRLLGRRVIRLDGRPITAWIAFERFGGYAASAAIGLLGFAQMLWDRNRQALHDKAVETVVIREQGGVPLRV